MGDAYQSMRQTVIWPIVLYLSAFRRVFVTTHNSESCHRHLLTGDLAGPRRRTEMSISRYVLLAIALGAAVPAQAKVQPFMTGWDDFNEPLNLANSSVKWSLSKTTKSLSITYTLVGANPTKLYQASIAIFCTTPPVNFGQFPVAGACQTTTRQGKTASQTAAEIGVILTNSSGAGSLQVSTGALPSGTYKVEFTVRNGAGCNVSGGGSDCDIAFQSPGPFDTVDTFTVP